MPNSTNYSTAAVQQRYLVVNFEEKTCVTTSLSSVTLGIASGLKDR